MTSVDYPKFLASHGLLSAVLERESGALSGSALSGSRILNLHANLNSGVVVGSRNLLMFTNYIKSTTFFADRVVIKY